MDKTLVRKKLRGYQIYNEWEQQEQRKQLPHVTIQQSVQRYLELQNLTRRLAPDARQFFFEDNLAHHVQTRARFRQIAKVLKHGSSR